MKAKLSIQKDDVQSVVPIAKVSFLLSCVMYRYTTNNIFCITTCPYVWKVNFDFLQFQQSELMNLAVLTGRQVAKQLKVYIVSHAGEIADVTLHSSCTSKDVSALKVLTVQTNFICSRIILCR